jgi:hypothetical protein
VVNVFLTSYSNKTVLREILRCLPMFPNLITVQLIGNGDYLPSEADIANLELPTVKTFVFARWATPLLKCFPNAISVARNSCPRYPFRDAQPIVTQLLPAHCPNLQHYEDLEFPVYYRDHHTASLKGYTTCFLFSSNTFS